MLLSKGKIKKIIIYIIFFLILTTINNYNFSSKIGTLFKIENVEAKGISNKLKEEINLKLQKLVGQNIFLLKKNNVNNLFKILINKIIFN